MGCITLCRGSVCWPFIQLKGRHSKNESMPAVLLFRSRPDKNHHSIQNCVILLAFFSWAINVRFIPFFVFRVLVKMTKNEKNQVYCLCLKMIADFVTETDQKQKLNETNMISWRKKREEKKGNTGPCRFVYCLWRGGFLLDQWAPAAPLELKSCLSFVSARSFNAHAHLAPHARRRLATVLKARTTQSTA